MIEKVLADMEKYHMFPSNGHLVAGVSGGADSVCLLWVLVCLRRRCGLKLTAVHVNHGLRREAGEDAAFVRSLCEDWRVPFVLEEADVELVARRERLSCEEAGRKVRYEAFARALERLDAGQKERGHIAVAHNSQDRAETLLFHLLRGTGLAGMGSIRPVRPAQGGGRIVRPLLFCSREEIEECLRKNGISWRTDGTNGEALYTRNRIRNRILPYAREAVCENAVSHLAGEAQLLAETADFVERKAAEALGRCAKRQEEGGWLVDTAAFFQEEDFLQTQMVLYCLQRLGTGRDLTAAHVAQVKRLFSPDCQSGRRVELPSCGIQADRQFGAVRLRRFRKETFPPETAPGRLILAEEGLREPEGLCLPLAGWGEARIRLISSSQAGETGFFGKIPEKKYTKWFDYDKITESAVFRTRQSGDYLTIDGALSKKSLKRYLMEEKIPADRRDRLLVLADGSHIMWVPGHRISAAYKVTERTKRILQIHLTGGKEDGGESGSLTDGTGSG